MVPMPVAIRSFEIFDQVAAIDQPFVEVISEVVHLCLSALELTNSLTGHMVRDQLPRCLRRVRVNGSFLWVRMTLVPSHPESPDRCRGVDFQRFNSSWMTTGVTWPGSRQPSPEPRMDPTSTASVDPGAGQPLLTEPCQIPSRLAANHHRQGGHRLPKRAHRRAGDGVRPAEWRQPGPGSAR